MQTPNAEITLGDRLITYKTILKQLDVVLMELESIGFVAIPERDRWEKLIVPERMRVDTAMKALGVSTLSKIPKLPIGTPNGH